MAKRQTFAEFERRANKKHGGKYTYVEESYSEIHAKVDIVCPEHGTFTQWAHSHVNKGHGCPTCARVANSAVKCTEEFVQQASFVHENAYDYSKVKFVSQNTKVTILCPDHGEFYQTPYWHIVNKGGCKSCDNEKRRMGLLGFIEKARATHGDKYRYPAQPYLNSYTKLTIECQKHGGFLQTPGNHLSGGGCPACFEESRGEALRSNLVGFITKAKAVHGPAYTYPEQGYVNSKSKLKIVCPAHGEFVQTANAHLAGQGCKECADESRRFSWEIFLERAKRVHGGSYVYQKQDFVHFGQKVAITCPAHGEFVQTASAHLAGNGCKRCHLAGMVLSVPAFEERARRVHGDRYEYPEQAYKGQKQGIVVTCPIHGSFKVRGNNHLQGSGCPKCSKATSAGERAVREFVESLGLQVNKGRNSALPGMGGAELDMVIHSKRVAVEYNGVYWHSSAVGKKKEYHLSKTKLVESLGYRLIHIFEDEWKEKQEIVKLRLTSILAPHLLKTVYARKCEVREINWLQAKPFLDKHHLQGSGRPGAALIGLTHADDLLAVATFGRPRYSKLHDWELLRFASQGRVIGGAGRLLAFFAKNFAGRGDNLISYADRRWSQGGLYEATGFTFAGYSAPGYSYVKQTKRLSRQLFQKHKLGELFGNFDPALTEEENCAKNRLFRIYDCGVSRWVKTL